MRFTGTIEAFSSVKVAGLVKWLKKIPEVEWPHIDGRQGWGTDFQVLADELIAKHYPGCRTTGIGLFILPAGKTYPLHNDDQPTEWVTRVHVPLTTNEGCSITMKDGEHHLEVGKAYRFNTLEKHALANLGKTPRAHLVFDVRN